MGIQGLLPQLKSIMVPVHIQDLRGQTVAVDTYSWLHKGALSCSLNLCKGIPTSKHIDYCMHRVNLLRHYGVKPILVFDGGFLPMKVDQETKRSRLRKENLERALEHEAAGNSAAAFECYQKAVDISPSVALGLIKVLKKEGIDYIVAPYEADAQMTFLCMKKHVDVVITEDSDLIPFGCSKIIFKMDKFGQGVLFQSSMLGQNEELAFNDFTKQMFLEMCILSGCDYLQSVPGMGLKRAHALIQKFKSYEKVIKHLRYSSVSVPPLYGENFRKAMWAFQHQRVYDPTAEEIVHLSDIPSDIGEDLDFLGPWLAPNVVKGIAVGDLDPFTKLPFQVEETRSEKMLDKSYSVKESVFANGRKRLNLPVQNNVLTNYFCLASLEAKRKFRAPKIMPKCIESTKSTSPDSESCESDSPGSTDDATPTENHQRSSLLSEDNINNLSAKVSLVLHQDQLIAPKMAPKATMESLSPGSNSQKSNPTISASDVMPTINHLECFQLLPRDMGSDHQSKKLTEGANDSNKPVKLQLKGNTVSSPNSHSLMELANTSLRPFLASHKERCKTTLDATKQGNCGLHGDKRNTKSLAGKVTKRSPYFLSKALDKNDSDIQKDEPLVHKVTDEDMGDHPVAAVALFRNDCQESTMKKRKLLHAHNLQSESQLERNLHITSVEGGGHISYLNKKCTNGKVEGNFGCDISHLKNYSGIAEKSVERFASLISSFRYTSSGSRASGLRPPLKDIQNTCPVRSIVVPIDFSKFAYKPKHKSV